MRSPYLVIILSMSTLWLFSVPWPAGAKLDSSWPGYGMSDELLYDPIDHNFNMSDERLL